MTTHLHPAVLLPLAVLAACGGSSPTSPTPAPAPPTATLRVVPGYELRLPDWPCPTGVCRYGFAFRNDGPDCATAVRGTLRLLAANGALLGTDEWALPPARRVAVNEVVEVEDGVLAKPALEASGEGRYSVVFQFDAVRCQ